MKSNIANILVKPIKSLAWCIYNSFHELNSDFKKFWQSWLTHWEEKWRMIAYWTDWYPLSAMGGLATAHKIIINWSRRNMVLRTAIINMEWKKKVKFWCFSKLKGETCYFTYIKFMTLLMNILAPIVDNLFSLHVFAD